MTDARTPRPGPHEAVADTPELAPDAVRRTTSTDVVRPGGFAGPVLADVRGRDVHRRPDGRLEVLDEVHVVLGVDGPSGDVVAVDGDLAGPARRFLEGANVRRGFGRALVAAVPDDAAGRSLRFSVLEDLNGALLVSGYAPLRQGLLLTSKDEGAARAEAQQDVCAGWARGGAVVELLRTAGETAVPMGPPAPPITRSRDRWHDVAAPALETVRRLRCLDVSVSDVDPAVATARAHLRDSYVGDDEEMVMHEYLVRARFDRHRLAMDVVEVEPRVLPWQSCPSAATSAATLVGSRVEELAGRVRAELVGPTTCTHLNSTLRSLADVQSLLTALDPDLGRSPS